MGIFYGSDNNNYVQRNSNQNLKQDEILLVNGSENIVSEGLSKSLMGICFNFLQSERKINHNYKKKSSESDVVELGGKIIKGKQKKLLIMRATNRRIPSVSSFKSKVMIPEDKFYILQSLTYNAKSKLRNGTEHGREVKGKRSARHSKSPTNYQQNASFTENAQKQITCSSRVYAFQRGLVSSEEAKTFNSFKPKHVLPAVIAERIRSVDQKKYRLVNVRQFFVFL